MSYILSEKSFSSSLIRTSWKKSIDVTPEGEFALPQGWVMKFIVPFFENDAVLRIGTAPGADDILADTNIPANSSDPIEIGFCDKAGVKGGIIYFTADVVGIIDIFRF